MHMQHAQQACTASLHAVCCCLAVTSNRWSAVHCSISTRVAHACLSLLWHVGQKDSDFKTELDKHVTAVACNLQGSKDFSAARYSLKRVLALHETIACLQGSEASAAGWLLRGWTFVDYWKSVKWVSSLRLGNARQKRQVVCNATACVPTTLMIFAECGVAINYANADSIEHCLTDSELRATHGHVGEGLWADRSQCEAYHMSG